MSIRASIVALGAAAAMAAATPAVAAGNLIVNGDFEQTVDPITGTNLTSSTQATTKNIVGWSSTGYNFIYLPSATATSGTTADTTGAYTPEYTGRVQLWGPDNGSANGLTVSPTGGNFIGADNNFEQGAVTQTITGLSAGAKYLLTFYWAAGQQSGFGGPTTENFKVRFGSQSFTTETVSTPSHGFTPWTKVTYGFNATASSQVLSFLAAGTPGGSPPFSLLDGVSLTAAPEPATWAVMLAGLAGVGLLVRRRRTPAAPNAVAA